MCYKDRRIFERKQEIYIILFLFVIYYIFIYFFVFDTLLNNDSCLALFFCPLDTSIWHF